MLKIVMGAAVALCLTSLPSQAQDVGVASCDKFLKTLNTCITAKAAPAQKAPITDIGSKMKANWIEVAKTPDGKAQLDAVCVKTADQMKQQLAALNCAW